MEVACGVLVTVGAKGVAVGAERTLNTAVTGVEVSTVGRLYQRMKSTVANKTKAKTMALATTQRLMIEVNQPDNFNAIPFLQLSVSEKVTR